MSGGSQGRDSKLQVPILIWDLNVINHLFYRHVTVLVISKTSGKMLEVWK